VFGKTYQEIEHEMLKALCRRFKADATTVVQQVDAFTVLMGLRCGRPFNANGGWLEINGELRRTYGWQRRKRGKRDVGLCRLHVMAHLRGQYVIAQPAGDFTRWVVIDLDIHNEADADSLLDRVARVRNALGDAPVIIVRSSTSWGLHLYYRLTDEVPSGQAHDEVVEALRRGGVEVKRGHVEVFPAGGEALRVPLGAGSTILDDATWEPLGARYTKCRRALLRDVAASLQLMRQLADERQVKLADLTSFKLTAVPGSIPTKPKGQVVAHMLEVGRGGAAPSSAGPAGCSPSPGSSSGDYFKRLAALQAGVSAQKMRYEEAKLLRWDLVRRQGLNHAQALAAFTEWLDRGQHHSRDLTHRWASTRKAMLRQADKAIAHLIRTAGQHGGQGRSWLGERAGRASWRSFATYLHYMRNHLGKRRWRTAARGALTAADHEALSRLQSDWVRQRLGLVLCVIRYGAAKFGHPRVLSVPRRALMTIAGGHPPPADALADRLPFDAASVDAWGVPKPEVKSAYGVVLSAAQRIGLLLRCIHGRPIRKVRATLFDVLMSPAATSAAGREQEESAAA
jgi:hypothetical protein